MAMSSGSNIQSRISDISGEPVDRLLVPIRGYQDQPILSLNETIEPISKFFNRIEDYVFTALHNSQNPPDELNQQESAVIHLYTMQFSGGPSLYEILNQTLRAENREELKPWFSFLKLFITALYKLPSRSETVWRGVKGVDLSSQYKIGTKFVWWGVSSCNTNINTLESESFLGKTGERTLFSIKCTNGKSIVNHSYFKKTEDEIILMPGSYFEVIGHVNLGAQLHLIELKQIEPPIPFLESPLLESTNTIHSKPSTLQQKPQVINSKMATAINDANTQEILNQMRYIMTQMYELNEFTTPHYFFILPAKNHDLTTTKTVQNLFQIHYKLYFLCECSDEPEKLHIAPHQGYLIKKQKEFIIKYGPYLRTILRLIQVLLTTPGFSIPQFDDIKERAEILERLFDKINTKLICTPSSSHQKANAQDVLPQCTDLRELESYLQFVDSKNSLGNLYRIVTTDGHVCWVCLEHYNAISFNKRMIEYIRQWETIGGRFNEEKKEAFINQVNLANKSISMFCETLKKGFNISKLIFEKCSIYEGDLDTLLDVIINLSSIRCLEIIALDVCSWIGMSKYVCQYMIIYFNNQSLKVRCHDHYQYGNGQIFTRVLMQNKIHQTLDFSACDVFGQEKELQRYLDANKMLTTLVIKYANNIDILNAISNLKNNTLHQLKLKYSLGLPSTLSRFCEILKNNQTLIEIDLMDSNEFTDETFIVNLLNTLREHKSIKHLSLRVCNISPSSQKEVCLRNSLLKDKFISRLCLSKSIISHEFTQALVHASQEHRSLIHLEFYENQIDANDILQLQSFYKNEILIHLIISEKPRSHSVQEQTKDELKSIPLRAPAINIHPNTHRWQQNGLTVAGGNGQGNRNNQLSNPCGLYIDDDDQTIYIADQSNHRIIEWKWNATSGQVVAGGNEKGNEAHQLYNPLDVIVDKERDNLIICDRGNRRVVRWPRRNGTSGETIISNIDCWGLTMDENGSLYVSDVGKHEVRRYRRGESQGTVVAGGNGNGNRLDQLYNPQYVFADRDHSVYVSDWGNHRVMKWMEGAKEGIIVAGGQDEGNSLRQLSYPQGVVVDQLDTVYVADFGNARIMRWMKGATQGNIIIGGNGEGKQSNQFNGPVGLSFDRHGNLYVVDHGNDRVQKFNIDGNA